MKVSIIIPVYNVSAYIERCIKSVMNQTYTDIECIIVDDATPDDSVAICEQMIAAYDGSVRFSILHHQKNRGLSAARNTGTNAAKGDYLYYLDSDDEITPDCIEVLLQPIIEDGSITLVQGNHIERNERSEFKYNKGTFSITITNHNDILKHYFKYHHIITTGWNKLIKRSFIETYQLYFKEGILHEDRLWMFYVQKHLEKAFICKDVTYIYNIRPDSITTKGKRNDVGNSYLYIYSDILNHLTHRCEKLELGGYVYGFCKPYCEYIDDIPALKETYYLYLKQAKHYNCWYVLFILVIIGAIRRIGNPIRIMKWFHTIRWKLVELPDRCFNKK